MNTGTCSPMIENYFAQLESKMADLPQNQRQEFLMELRAHVMDRLEQVAAPSEEDCRNVLNALGTPEEIARQYRMELLLKRSTWRISPISVLRTTLRWTVAGIQGYLVFIVAMIGYVISACFFVTALLKPIFPHYVGLFVNEEGVQIARFPMQPHGHELLGNYFIPVAIILGYLITLATTLLIRFLARHGRSLRQRLA
ncbi:MAG TPA: DUF1700 domain-containing protein [Candidatus Angelobacter sp.]